MNLRGQLLAAASCLFVFSACKKQKTSDAAVAPAIEEPSQNAVSSADVAKGCKLLGEAQAEKMDLSLRKDELNNAKKFYEMSKDGLNGAVPGAAMERAKLQIEERRQELAKAEADYQKTSDEIDAKLKEAKELLGDKFEGIYANLKKNDHFDEPAN